MTFYLQYLMQCLAENRPLINISQMNRGGWGADKSMNEIMSVSELSSSIGVAI